MRMDDLRQNSVDLELIHMEPPDDHQFSLEPFFKVRPSCHLSLTTHHRLAFMCYLHGWWILGLTVNEAVRSDERKVKDLNLHIVINVNISVVNKIESRLKDKTSYRHMRTPMC